MVVMPDADMDQAADALMGAGYGSAGERCMAISVAVPVGEETADALIEKLKPRVEALKIGPSTDGETPTWARWSPRGIWKRCAAISTRASSEGATSSSTAAVSRCRATRTAIFIGGCRCSTASRPDMTIYKEEIFGPFCRSCAPRPTRKRST
jgi:malonate-semialdehyde dehydrogenase (acetylating)/methylmalonate-semialdehyde dehydrogenase